MNILIDIAHPATVHLYRNFIFVMKAKGHNVIITARDKDITFKLLNTYNLPYIVLGKHYKTFIGKIYGTATNVLKLLYYCTRYKIDIIMEAGLFYPTFVAFLLRKKSIVVANTDAGPILSMSKNFGAIFISPVSNYKDCGKNHFKYEIINELAFLHPKYFTPNKEILNILEVKENEKIILLRFVLWQAIDDFGYSGYSVKEIRNLVKEFSRFGKVLISCEYDLPEDLEPYHIEKNEKIKFGQLQNIEYYSTLFFGESGAMAAECAILGVPAIFVSMKKLGFINELDSKYGLVHCYNNKMDALTKALAILSDDNIKNEYIKKKEKLLSEKINITEFLVWFTENMPASLELIRSNNQFYKKFLN